MVNRIKNDIFYDAYHFLNYRKIERNSNFFGLINQLEMYCMIGTYAKLHKDIKEGLNHCFFPSLIIMNLIFKTQ